MFEAIADQTIASIRRLQIGSIIIGMDLKLSCIILDPFINFYKICLRDFKQIL